MAERSSNTPGSSQAARRRERREHMRSVTRGVGTTLYMSPEQIVGKNLDA